MAEENWVYSPSGVGYNWTFNPESYDEQFARNANQVSNILVTNWEDAGTLKGDLMESSEHVKGQKWLKRNLPLKCPEAEKAYLTSMKKARIFMPKGDSELADYGVQDRDKKTGWWTAGKIHYLCTFTNLPYIVKSDDDVKSKDIPELERYVKIQPQAITTNRTVATKTSWVLDDPLAPESDKNKHIYEPQMIPETIIRFMVTLYRWPKEAVNWATIFDRTNKVNDDAFKLYGIDHPKESLAFEGLSGQPEEEDGPDGYKYVNFTLSFLRHPDSWNKTLWPSKDGVVQYLYFKLKGTEPPVRRYRLASFKELFFPV